MPEVAHVSYADTDCLQGELIMAIEGLHPILGTPVVNKEQEASEKLQKEKRRKKKKGKEKKNKENDRKEGRIDIRV